MLKHLDEARRDVIEAARLLVGLDVRVEKLLVIHDLLGKFRVIAWPVAGASEAEVKQACVDRLSPPAAHFWSGDVWMGGGKRSATDAAMYDHAWNDGADLAAGGRLRLLDRERSRTTWLHAQQEPPWLPDEATGQPPIVAFYSFKGGVGRTTSLASFALQRAREGESVVVVDLDLDAPGAGTLLAADEAGTTARWGVVDYLLEAPLGPVELSDYVQACRRHPVTRSGEILVVPAGSLAPGRDYVEKLGRLELQPEPAQMDDHPLTRLLRELRDRFKPKWILLDARAGLAESAGLVLRGMAHLHVLFGTSSAQSWDGLRLVLGRLGAQRVLARVPQRDVLLVHAMVTPLDEAARRAEQDFAARARDEFESHYYATDPDDAEEDAFWYVRDAESSDAPHVPVHIRYEMKFSSFASIDAIADDLARSPAHQALHDRIRDRFAGARGAE